MTRRIKLPDFGTYFRTTSGSPIEFECRDAPNLLHDVIFLRSYIHDASFEVSKIHQRGDTLHIPMQRDRWERYNKKSRKLESIASSLVISPVLGLKWESKGRIKKSNHYGKSLIRDIYLGESYGDSSDKAEFVLSSFGKNPTKLRVTVRDPFSIPLTDAQRKQ